MNCLKTGGGSGRVSENRRKVEGERDGKKKRRRVERRQKLKRRKERREM